MTPPARPPAWLIVATAAMAAILLAMAVTETSFNGQYLVDRGESLSLVGLVFILVAGIYLHRRQRLVASLPLVFPWLFYPVITQGDQIIDNLPIDAMRWIVHLLLAVIFAMPVAVIVLVARYSLKRDLGRERTAMLTVALLALEMILANLFLGTLMIISLVVMILAVILYAAREPRPVAADPTRAERVAVIALVCGVVVSGGLYLGFKNRPGAYQGSPSFYMDPSSPEAGFNFAAVGVPAGAATGSVADADVQEALTAYGGSLQKLLDGYYVLDRNYNYHFHNELFLRSTPLLANYRAVGLGMIGSAAALRADGDAATARALAVLPKAAPLAAVLEDVRGYVAYSFERAATLERMTAAFETTKAGLQHATHVYEGEGKFLGVGLAQLLDKHQAALSATAPVTRGFVIAGRAIHDKYANRIVGF